MTKGFKELFGALERRGCKAKLISVEHMAELQNEIKSLYEKGLLDDVVYERYLKRYDYDSQMMLSKYKSILILAVPQPISTVSFAFNGARYSAIIPPTYIFSTTYNEIEGLLGSVLEEYGYKSERALLPLKLLAARCGLGTYGRNNICYVPGMGSFHRIIAYFTELPCEADSWQAANVMARCENCTACAKSCPTSCIPSDCFLIRAENCLTNLNENTDAFPDWVKADWHNALVGCMQCQKVCPENKPFLNNQAEAACFSENETKAILEETPFDRLPEETARRLEALDMAEYYSVLARNLRVLI